MAQGDLLGLLGGNGGGATGAAGAGGGPLIVLRLMVVGEDIAGGGVDLIVVLGVVGGVVKLHLIDPAAVFPVQVGPDEGDLAGGEPGVIQGDLLGPLSGDGSGAGAARIGIAGVGVSGIGAPGVGAAGIGISGGGIAGAGIAAGVRGPGVVLHVKVIGEDVAGGGVDLIVVLNVAGGVVELHIIDLAAVLPVQGAPQEGDLVGGEARVVQGDLLGLLGGDGGARAGAGGFRRAAEDATGERVNVIGIALAVGGEVKGVDAGAALPVQLRGGEGGGGLGHAGVLQGDGLGGVQADETGGVLLPAGGEGNGE